MHSTIANEMWLWSETQTSGMDHISASSTLIREQKPALMIGIPGMFEDAF